MITPPHSAAPGRVPGLQRHLGDILDLRTQVLAAYLDGLEADPEGLEAIETRREGIAHLTRKYRRSVSELLEQLLWAWLQGGMSRPGRIAITQSTYEGAGFVPW